MQFTLVPFTPAPDIPTLTGELLREKNHLKLVFHPIETTDLVWPTSDQQSERRDNLWQSTCFECFIGTTETESYIEINASPEQHWQAYYFDSYRHNQQCEGDINVQVAVDDNALTAKPINLNIDIPTAGFVTADWQISVSAILQRQSGEQMYFAIQHPQGKPDFHCDWLRSITLPYKN